MSKINRMMLIMGTVLALSACGAGSSSTPPAASAGTVSTSLSPTTVTSPNGTTTLTITITNTSSTAVTGGALSIPMPAGTKATTQSAVGSPCTNTSITTGSIFKLGGLSVPANGTCTNTYTLTPSTPGTTPATHVFTPSGLTNITAGTTATLEIQ